MRPAFRFVLTFLGLVPGVAAGGPPGPWPISGGDAAARAGSSISESLQRPWKRLTQSNQAAVPRWDWVTACPHAATRAEVVIPTVPRAALIALTGRQLPGTTSAPDGIVVADSVHDAATRAMAGPGAAARLSPGPQTEIRLARAEVGAAPDYRVTAVNGRPVPDYNQFHAALTRASDTGKPATVTLASTGAGDSLTPSLSLPPVQLAGLSQAVVPQERLLRVIEGGNPWLVFRENRARCKVLVRVEREHGLVLVALAPGIGWGPQAMLPREVRAWGDGAPLQCLTVAETLDALYGGPKGKVKPPRPEACSFAAVSEREDYRLPSNFKRLQEALNKAGDSAAASPRPAFATLPGLTYPGPAILGDARALAAFLQQRQLYRPGEPEQVGWIIFAGGEVTHSRLIHLDVDLGEGPRRLTFGVPGS